jgi:hypothetical protein
MYQSGFFVKFYIGDRYDCLSIDSKFCHKGQNIGQFTRRLQYILLFPANLNYHKSAVFGWNGDRVQWRTEGMVWGVQPPPPPEGSEVLTKLSRIPISVENTSATTWYEYGFHSFANWAESLNRCLPPHNPRSLWPVSSTEFVEPPRTKFLGKPLTAC